MAKFRTFIAIDTPPEIRPHIVELQQQLKETQADVRWEPPEKLHATLKFLGETDESKLQPIAAALGTIAHGFSALTLSYRTVGCFPTTRAPRVVWVGLEEPSGRLEALQRQIEDSLTQFGFEKEERQFHPHLTLGRVKGQHRLHSLLERLKTVTFESQPVTIRELIIVKSDLRPSGSVYTTLKSVPLGP
jgi:2'-5' RNA ligase